MDNTTENTWNIIGHTAIIALLQRAIMNATLNHAYLFAGIEHIGKSTLAKKFAQTLLCTSTDNISTAPCEMCLSCKKFLHENHPDMHTIQRESGSQFIGIEQIRILQSESARKTLEGRYSIFLIEDAHTMNEQAENCLLKTLEEPASSVLLLLTTTETSLLLPTILSRVQSIAMHTVPTAMIEKVLEEQEEIEKAEARKVAALSQGKIGWAIKASRNEKIVQEYMLHQKEIEEVLTESIANRFKRAERMSGNTDEVSDKLQEWIAWWQNTLLQAHKETKKFSFAGEGGEEATLSTTAIQRAIEVTIESATLLEHNVSARVVLEHLFLHLPIITGNQQ